MASPLDPFGSVASSGAVSGGALANKAGEGIVEDDNHRSKTRD
ncbi:hypothetical protein ACFVSW_08080 [Neobacillus sp. NPDC058068]